METFRKKRTGENKSRMNETFFFLFVVKYTETETPKGQKRLHFYQGCADASHISAARHAIRSTKRNGQMARQGETTATTKKKLKKTKKFRAINKESNKMVRRRVWTHVREFAHLL